MDATLKAEVPLEDDPVAADDVTSDSLHASAPPSASVVASSVAEVEAEGAVIGRYRLMERIGEGGFGAVYVAEQREPVKRRVALKIIKLGMDTRAVVARFEAERQALAVMDHPNIARVLDAGATQQGRPFFVMELVRGVPITQYCDQNHLPPADRLKLFVHVCNALQHAAHQKGIIHRDVKPSNILVTMHDGTPVPKVIDFGIAKATQGELTDKTIYTQFQQFIGTPAYMSPEQAEMSGLDIDTRTDIYSLGVLLYELLTGRTPFDAQELAAGGVDAMRRTIREEEAVRPSARLSKLMGDESTATAKRYGSDMGRLVTMLRGDLDWVVMKCLEKDRTRRYVTANELAVDITRYLNDEPVTARPPSTAYRFSKLVRRNRLVFIAGSSVAAALLIATVLSTHLYLQARDALKREQVARARAEAAEQEQATLRLQAENALDRAALESAVSDLMIAAKTINGDYDLMREELRTLLISHQLRTLLPLRPGSLDTARAAVIKKYLAKWRPTLAAAEKGIAEHPGERWVRHAAAEIMGMVATANFDAGEIAEAKRVATEWIDADRSGRDANTANVVSSANLLLGRIALREGDVPAASDYLLKAGHTTGSAQLSTFGPGFALARELLVAGQKQAVLDYLDLVEKFWATADPSQPGSADLARDHRATLNRWRDQIRNGQTPDDPEWLR